jgi:hypothetical protein
LADPVIMGICSLMQFNFSHLHRQTMASVLIIFHVICCLVIASILSRIMLIRNYVNLFDVEVTGKSFLYWALFVGVILIATHIGGMQVNI